MNLLPTWLVLVGAEAFHWLSGLVGTVAWVVGVPAG